MNVREWALPVYTILMQLGTGTLLILWLIRAANLKSISVQSMDQILRRPVIVIFFTFLVAVIASHFHLSNPLASFLAVLNVKNSWLSREIVFNILTFFACAALIDQLNKPEHVNQRLKNSLGWAVILFGSASIYCMSRIYLLPTQPPWNHSITALMFLGSALLLGITSAAALLIMDAIFIQEHELGLAEARAALLKRNFGWMTWLITGSTILVIALNLAQNLIFAQLGGLARLSLDLLLGLYQSLLGVRFLFLLAGMATFILVTFWMVKKNKALPELTVPVYLACFMVLVAEILGRFLFYATHVRLGI